MDKAESALRAGVADLEGLRAVGSLDGFAVLVDGIRDDLREVERACASDPRLRRRGPEEVGRILGEGRQVIREFQEAAGALSGIVAGARGRGYFTKGEIGQVADALRGIAGLAARARRLRLRAEGPRLRLVG